MYGPVLITGSAGLLGAALAAALRAAGQPVRGFDLRASGPDHGDTRDAHAVRRAVRGASGVVHLAAVSRVAWAEADPQACWDTNVVGTQHVLDACLADPEPPWLVFASSREVYGPVETVPVPESAPLRPMNHYARAKVAGEAAVHAATAAGLRTSVVRLSNVYGRTTDHADRVLPAFARAAAHGAPLRVDGAGHTFDFTHLDDVLAAFEALIPRVAAGAQPTLNLCTGEGTSLGALAALARRLARSASEIVEAEPRSYDVSHFVGDPSAAYAALGWRASVPVEAGLARLIADYRALGAP